jgi:hypothetical protein
MTAETATGLGEIFAPLRVALCVNDSARGTEQQRERDRLQ